MYPSIAIAAEYETFRRWLVVPGRGRPAESDAEELLMDAQSIADIEVGEVHRESRSSPCR